MKTEKIDGALLRSCRTGRGMSVRGLAEASGVNKTTIQRIEKGEVSPSLAVLEKILSALSLSLKIDGGESEKKRT